VEANMYLTDSPNDVIFAQYVFRSNCAYGVTFATLTSNGPLWKAQPIDASPVGGQNPFCEKAA